MAQRLTHGDESRLNQDKTTLSHRDPLSKVFVTISPEPVMSPGLAQLSPGNTLPSRGSYFPFLIMSLVLSLPSFYQHRLGCSYKSARVPKAGLHWQRLPDGPQTDEPTEATSGGMNRAEK